VWTREEILLPDRQSAELAAAARRNNPAAFGTILLEYVDETLRFVPEWVVDRIAPRPVLFITTDDDRLVPPEESYRLYERAGEPKKLVVLRSEGGSARGIWWSASGSPRGRAPPAEGGLTILLFPIAWMGFAARGRYLSAAELRGDATWERGGVES
jgi:hypothetical protein